MLKKLKATLANTFKSGSELRRLEQKFGRLSYAQEGEDIVLAKFFEGQKKGFYLDVGAHHPIRFSNTYYFYLRGWRGINIDAMPGAMELFNQYRPTDINIECPVSSEETELTYYRFNEPALNGFSKEISENRDRETKYKIIDRTPIKTRRLESILEERLPVGQAIDFLSIDVEGLDLNVLQSNNWEKYRPRFILIEAGNGFISSVMTDEIAHYLQEKGYAIIAKTFYTSFFCSKEDIVKYV